MGATHLPSTEFDGTDIEDRLEAEAEAGRAAVRLAFPLVLCFLPAFALVVVVPTVAGAVKALVP